ncbi:hypothetical protein [Actinomadura rupiterrae]|uniref:hypothetical protein n=1 Tax=Actinomadura rupiterrae TaxID=559627 RepID=UPI0020A333CA|nr:hypothetical protein [Actinomadura rupiterrae]MCP2338206.1 hypothetical protein [Actinomadura rupiterrae]
MNRPAARSRVPAQARRSRGARPRDDRRSQPSAPRGDGPPSDAYGNPAPGVPYQGSYDDPQGAYDARAAEQDRNKRAPRREDAPKQRKRSTRNGTTRRATSDSATRYEDATRAGYQDETRGAGYEGDSRGARYEGETRGTGYQDGPREARLEDGPRGARYGGETRGTGYQDGPRGVRYENGQPPAFGAGVPSPRAAATGRGDSRGFSSEERGYDEAAPRLGHEPQRGASGRPVKGVRKGAPRGGRRTEEPSRGSYGDDHGPDGLGGQSAKRKRGPSARAYFGWAAGLAVLLVVGMAALLVGTHDTRAKGKPDDGASGQAAQNGVSPSTYSSSPSTRAYAGIEKRSADTAPLTEGEAFPPDATTVEVSGKAKLTLRAKQLSGDCTSAVWGSDIAKGLHRAGCTQAARTLYADTAHGYALSVTVFNLVDAPSANAVVDALGQGRGGGFAKPLTSDGPLGTFGQQGYGAARGVAMGHFAVVAWAQHLTGTGDAASAAKDETLLSILIEGQKAPAPLDRAARTS